MNQAERRRKRLLEQTRNLYCDNRIIPAVHPRYKAAYNHLYFDETELRKGTFGLRCWICILVFAAYVVMGKYENTISGINNVQVQEMIMQNILSGLY